MGISQAPTGPSGPKGPLPEQLAARSSETAETAGLDTESLHWGNAWVWFPAVVIRVIWLKNRKEEEKLS